MTDQRTVEDRLREEYSLLLPEIRRVTEQLEAEVRYCVLPILRTLNKYENLVVKSRIKECESAIDSLRRRPLVDPKTGERLGEGKTFDRDRPALYSLTHLNDLAGVRVLAFPRRRVKEVDQELRKRFESWQRDDVPGVDKGDPPRVQILRLLSGGEHQGSRRVPGSVDAYWTVYGSRAPGHLQARPGTKGCTP